MYFIRKSKVEVMKLIDALIEDNYDFRFVNREIVIQRKSMGYEYEIDVLEKGERKFINLESEKNTKNK